MVLRNKLGWSLMVASRSWLADHPLAVVLIAGAVFIPILLAFQLPLRTERQLGTVSELTVGGGRNGVAYIVWTTLPDGHVPVSLWGGSACAKGDKIEVEKTYHLLRVDYLASPAACSAPPKRPLG
jgi:hypothetical protein